METNERHDTLRVTPERVTISILTEPFVIHTYKGYAAVVNVKLEKDEPEDKTLFIAPKSLADPLKELSETTNDGKMTGLHVAIKKESNDRFARYVVEKVG